MAAPKNTLKAALSQGEVQLGIWLALVSPAAAEIAAEAGFDWALIDAEHGPMGDTPEQAAEVVAATR